MAGLHLVQGRGPGSGRGLGLPLWRPESFAWVCRPLVQLATRLNTGAALGELGQCLPQWPLGWNPWGIPPQACPLESPGVCLFNQCPR